MSLDKNRLSAAILAKLKTDGLQWDTAPKMQPANKSGVEIMIDDIAEGVVTEVDTNYAGSGSVLNINNLTGDGVPKRVGGIWSMAGVLTASESDARYATPTQVATAVSASQTSVLATLAATAATLQPLSLTLTAINTAAAGSNLGYLKRVTTTVWNLVASIPWADLAGVTSVLAGTGLTGGGSLVASVTLAVAFAGSGSAATVARSDHNHTGTYLVDAVSDSTFYGRKNGLWAHASSSDISGLTGWATKTFTNGSTTDVAEGTNLYFTNARAQATISGTAPISVVSGVVSHSTADGYLHVPATGTTHNGQVLMAGATAGSLTWSALPTSLPPTAHASTHLAGGSDQINGQSLAGLRTSDQPQFAGLTSTGLTQINSPYSSIYGQLTVGSASQAGWISFRRGSDGSNCGGMGYIASATESSEVRFQAAGGGGYFAWWTDNAGMGQRMRLSNTGTLSVTGGVSATSFSVPGGASTQVLMADGTMSSMLAVPSGQIAVGTGTGIVGSAYFTRGTSSISVTGSSRSDANVYAGLEGVGSSYTCPRLILSGGANGGLWEVENYFTTLKFNKDSITLASISNAGLLTLSGGLATAGSISGGSLNVDKAAGNVRDIYFNTSGVVRWVFRVNSNGEAGSNTGSDLEIMARSDAGALIDVPIAITRAAGGPIIIGGSTSRAVTLPSANTTGTGGILYISSTGVLSKSTSGADLPGGPYLPLTGGTLSGQLSINGAASTYRVFAIQTAGSTRWLLRGSNGSESGSDAGTDFQLQAFHDTGLGIDTPITITRAPVGAITMTRPVNIDYAWSTLVSELNLTNGGSARWTFQRTTSATENGTGLGSNFNLIAKSDSGSVIDTPISIARIAGGSISLVRPVSSTQSVTASSFVKTLGTSLQFLKADGSVDANAYLTANQAITLSGDVTGSGTTTILTSISSAIVTGKVLTGYVSGSNAALLPTDSVLAAFGKIQGQLDGKQSVLSNPVTGTGASGRVAFWSSASATTSSAEFTWDGKILGIGLSNSISSPSIKLQNNTGVAGGPEINLIGAAGTASDENSAKIIMGGGSGSSRIISTTQPLFKLQRHNGTAFSTIFESASTLPTDLGLKFYGSVAALNFVKTGGVSSQFLKADGSVDSSVYALASAVPVAASAIPSALGTAAVGTGTTWARADHVHQMPTAAQLGAASALHAANHLAGGSDQIAGQSLYGLRVTDSPSFAGLTTSGSITALSFIKQGGAGTDYLMADGTVSQGPFVSPNDLTSMNPFYVYNLWCDYLTTGLGKSVSLRGPVTLGGIVGTDQPHFKFLRSTGFFATNQGDLYWDGDRMYVTDSTVKQTFAYTSDIDTCQAFSDANVFIWNYSPKTALITTVGASVMLPSSDTIGRIRHIVAACSGSISISGANTRVGGTSFTVAKGKGMSFVFDGTLWCQIHP